MQVHLYDRYSQQAVPADIRPMSDLHFLRLTETWIPAFQERYRHQICDGDFSLWQPTCSPLDGAPNSANHQGFVLTVDDSILGVLCLQNQLQSSRLQQSTELVYVRYVATAPWNRPEKSAQGRLRGVGTTLMDWAISQSQTAGCDGRIGLHSLRGSDAFYQRLSFHNLGSDPAHWGMTYFEKQAAPRVDPTPDPAIDEFAGREPLTMNDRANIEVAPCS